MNFKRFVTRVSALIVLVMLSPLAVFTASALTKEEIKAMIQGGGGSTGTPSGLQGIPSQQGVPAQQGAPAQQGTPAQQGSLSNLKYQLQKYIKTGMVGGFIVDNGGTDYGAPRVTGHDANGRMFSGKAMVKEGSIASITILDAGRGLVEPLTVDITDPTGYGAAARAYLASSRFGMDYFIPARARIDDLERRIADGTATVPSLNDQAAISSFVGPLEMLNTSVANAPQRYVLSSGDRLTVAYWSQMQELVQLAVVVDDNGDVVVPRAGKLNARGMTLDQFQGGVKDMLRRTLFKDAEVLVTMDRLKSIQVYFTGEVYRPGSYAVSSVSSLFNALYAAGGPSDKGSLREIKLIRGQKTIHIDLYDYLLRGDSSNDIVLQAGDAIFIEPKHNEVTVSGEVYRPALFELRKGETLKSILELAGGIKTSGYLEKIHIRTITPNKERKSVDVSINAKGEYKDQELFDGDSVTVLAINGDIENIVYLSGKVDVPGEFQWVEGMRLADLFSSINKPGDDAYLERADIVRMNEDKKTTTLISVNLAKALAKDPANNIILAKLDNITVYSKWDVQFIPDDSVQIFGAVPQPGRYKRSNGMRFSDLLVKAGGPLPGHLDQAEISRTNELGELKIINVDIDSFFKGAIPAKDGGKNAVNSAEDSQDILLKDLDVVVIKKRTEFFDKPQFVTITGEVKYPGVYALRSRNEKMTDIIKRAGGFTAEAYPKGIVFNRMNHNLNAEQSEDLKRINKIFRLVNEMEFNRQGIKARYLMAKEQASAAAEAAAPVGGGTPVISSGTSVKQAMAMSVAPGVAQSTQQTVNAGMGAALDEMPSVVSPARSFSDEDLVPGRRLIVDAPGAMAGPGGKKDVTIMDNDSIQVPRQPEMVRVVGAVMMPNIMAYNVDYKPEMYVAMSGGFTEDANMDRVVVVRMDGSILAFKDLKKIEQGDVVYVPAKVMGTEIVERIDKIIGAVKYGISAVVGTAIFFLLIHMI